MFKPSAKLKVQALLCRKVSFFSPPACSRYDGSFAQGAETAEMSILSIAVERTAMERPSAAYAAETPKAINSFVTRWPIQMLYYPQG